MWGNEKVASGSAKGGLGELEPPVMSPVPSNIAFEHTLQKNVTITNKSSPHFTPAPPSATWWKVPGATYVENVDVIDSDLWISDIEKMIDEYWIKCCDHGSGYLHVKNTSFEEMFGRPENFTDRRLAQVLCMKRGMLKAVQWKT